MAEPTADLPDFLVSSDMTLRDAAERIGKNLKGIVVVVDEKRRLLDTITDGDIRRAILAGKTLGATVGSLRERRASSVYRTPVVAPAGMDRATLIARMRREKVRQLPLVSEDGQVVDVVTLEELTSAPSDLSAVIMAGGFGKRLHPLTNDTPKPMLPVGERPIMEHLVNQLRDSGVRVVNVTTHFQPEKIQQHFGDGSDFGVEVRYVSEEKPLGTAGALGLLSSRETPMLIINGDILTQVSFQSMYEFHREHAAELTVAVRQYEVSVPYGVVECDGELVTELREKPTLSFLVNAGIYLLEPSVFELIPVGERFDMTDLIDALVARGRRVVSFPVVEYWMDIGQHDDYRRAQEDYEKVWKT